MYVRARRWCFSLAHSWWEQWNYPYGRFRAIAPAFAVPFDGAGAKWRDIALKCLFVLRFVLVFGFVFVIIGTHSPTAFGREMVIGKGQNLSLFEAMPPQCVALSGGMNLEIQHIVRRTVSVEMMSCGNAGCKCGSQKPWILQLLLLPIMFLAWYTCVYLLLYVGLQRYNLPCVSFTWGARCPGYMWFSIWAFFQLFALFPLELHMPACSSPAQLAKPSIDVINRPRVLLRIDDLVREVVHIAGTNVQQQLLFVNETESGSLVSFESCRGWEWKGPNNNVLVVPLVFSSQFKRAWEYLMTPYTLAPPFFSKTDQSWWFGNTFVFLAALVTFAIIPRIGAHHPVVSFSIEQQEAIQTRERNEELRARNARANEIPTENMAAAPPTRGCQ
jgi:hypothetical protein